MLSRWKWYSRCQKSSSLSINEDHRLPQIGNPTCASKCNEVESLFGQKLVKAVAGPKLDMTAVPQRRPVMIPLAGDRDRQILEVAMVRCAQNEMTAAAENL